MTMTECSFFLLWRGLCDADTIENVILSHLKKIFSVRDHPSMFALFVIKKFWIEVIEE
jgi:hypothetical protein